VKPLQRLAPDWQLLSRLLDEALALPAQERQAWLAALAPEAEHLRPQLRDLLEVQEAVETGTFLEALPVLPGLRPAAGGVQPGDTVGPYRIVGELGRGGMGTVWLAERADGQLKRRCALKLPAFAWSDALRERMAQERDILASLDHPHIARLLDAGADEQGRPFLALEHVQGEAIDRWADRKLLPVRARVELFVQVVDAIRYAHANLVIHRDLKPSNILVTDAGQCKLLDFGIAKLMSDAQAAEQAAAPPDLTLTGQRLLTPRYASPEQVLGQRLTAASDVYSLGVVLYELLCGSTPYEAGDSARPLLEQTILDGHVRAASRQPEDGEAARLRGTTPQRLARQLRGELDAILLRALGRQPQDRYPSAEALQADLLAWLGNRPIQARKPGVLATAWKFVRRHRWPVAIGTAGVVATVVMALVAAGMAWRSSQELTRGEAARGFLADLLKEANPSRRQGRQLSLREMLEQAEANVESKYSRQPELRERVYREVADLWAEFGEHGRRATALRKRSMALSIIGNRVALADSLVEEARVTADLLKDLDRADRLLSQAQAISKDVELPPTVLFQLDLWWGWLDTFRWRPEVALAAFQRAEVHANNSGNSYFLGLSIRGQSLSQSRLGLWQDADDSLQRVRALIAKAGTSWAPEELRIVRWELAQEMLRRGQYRAGWDDVQQLMREDATSRGPFSLSSMGDHMLWLRYCIALRQEHQAAAWLLARSKALGQTITAPRSPDWSLLEAQVMSLVGQSSDALDLIQQADEAAQGWPEGESKDELRIRIDVARARIGIQLGELRLLDRAVAALAPGSRKAQLSEGGERQRQRAHIQFRALAERMRNGPESVQMLGQAADLLDTALGPSHPEAIAMRLNLALGQLDLGFPETVTGDFAATARALAAALPGHHPLQAILADLVRGFNEGRRRPQGSGAAKTLLKPTFHQIILP
jgi:hypothetical protein